LYRERGATTYTGSEASSRAEAAEAILHRNLTLRTNSAAVVEACKAVPWGREPVLSHPVAEILAFVAAP